MKMLIKTAALFLLLCCFNNAFAQQGPNANNAILHTLHAEGTGTVYFIRHTGFEGSAVTFKAVIDKDVVCKLGNKKYSIHQIPTGEHTFSVQFSGKQSEPLPLNIEEGKTYYLYMVMQPGVMKTAFYCIEITEQSAKPFLSLCEQDSKCL